MAIRVGDRVLAEIEPGRHTYATVTGIAPGGFTVRADSGGLWTVARGDCVSLHALERWDAMTARTCTTAHPARGPATRTPPPGTRSNGGRGGVSRDEPRPNA